MDWFRLLRAIGIGVGIIGIVAGVSWIITFNALIAIYIFIPIALIGSIVVVYTILGE